MRRRSRLRKRVREQNSEMPYIRSAGCGVRPERSRLRGVGTNLVQTGKTLVYFDTVTPGKTE